MCTPRVDNLARPQFIFPAICVGFISGSGWIWQTAEFAVFFLCVGERAYQEIRVADVVLFSIVSSQNFGVVISALNTTYLCFGAGDGKPSFHCWNEHICVPYVVALVERTTHRGTCGFLRLHRAIICARLLSPGGTGWFSRHPPPPLDIGSRLLIPLLKQDGALQFSQTTVSPRPSETPDKVRRTLTRAICVSAFDLYTTSMVFSGSAFLRQ